MQNNDVLNIDDIETKEATILRQVMDIVIPKKLQPNTGRSKNNPKGDGYDDMRLAKAQAKRDRRAARDFRNAHRMTLANK
jgi:hypothetical protein